MLFCKVVEDVLGFLDRISKLVLGVLNRLLETIEGGGKVFIRFAGCISIEFKPKLEGIVIEQFFERIPLNIEVG